jgi:hypothetical protein
MSGKPLRSPNLRATTLGAWLAGGGKEVRPRSPALVLKAGQTAYPPQAAIPPDLQRQQIDQEEVAPSFQLADAAQPLRRQCLRRAAPVTRGSTYKDSFGTVGLVDWLRAAGLTEKWLYTEIGKIFDGRS